MLTKKPRRRERKGPRSIEGQFSPRLIEMLESPPWRILSLSARRVIERIEIEHGHHGGRLEENGRLPVTYDQFEEYGGMDRHAIGPAIREAVALGFIDIAKQGRAGNAEYRTPTLYRLTYRPAKGFPGNGCSHEWRKFGTIEEAKLAAKTAREAKPEKTKSQWGKTPSLGGENPTETRPFLVGKTPLKTPESLVGKTPTTIDISGRGRGTAEGGMTEGVTTASSGSLLPPVPTVH